MSTGTIIAISIVMLSILMLAVVGAISYNEMKPTMDNFKKLKETIEQKSSFYASESENINERVTLLSHDTDLIKKEIQEKNVLFEEFTHERGKLQSSVRYLQRHAGNYSKGIATNIKDEIKDDGPKIIKKFKLAFKKTIQKQKERRKIKDRNE